MDINDARTEQILAYLQGEMKEEARREFQQQLESDAALWKEVEACRLMVDEFRKRKYRAFLEEVEGYDGELPVDNH